MRKSLWIMPLLFAAIGAPSAHADTVYTINFTQTSGTDPMPSGTIVLSTTTIEPLTAQISWDGFSFFSSIVPPAASVILWPPPTPCVGADDVATVLTMLLGCPNQNQSLQWFAETDNLVLGQPARFTIFVSTSNTAYQVLFINTSGAAFAASPTSDQGTFTVTPTVATPEPGAGVLTTIGIVLVLVMRKRIAQRLRPDTGTHHTLSLPAPY